MTDLRKNALIIQGRFLVEDPAKAEMSIGEWIDLYIELRRSEQLSPVQKTLAAGYFEKLVQQINTDLAA